MVARYRFQSFGAAREIQFWRSRPQRLRSKQPPRCGLAAASSDNISRGIRAGWVQSAAVGQAANHRRTRLSRPRQLQRQTGDWNPVGKNSSRQNHLAGTAAAATSTEKPTFARRHCRRFRVFRDVSASNIPRLNGRQHRPRHHRRRQDCCRRRLHLQRGWLRRENRLDRLKRRNLRSWSRCLTPLKTKIKLNKWKQK